MRISDWSSDVCSSDLRLHGPGCPENPDPVAGGSAIRRRGAGRLDRPGPRAILVRSAGDREMSTMKWILPLFVLLSFALAPQARAESSRRPRSEEHTSELQSLMRSSYAVFCLEKQPPPTTNIIK